MSPKPGTFTTSSMTGVLTADQSVGRNVPQGVYKVSVPPVEDGECKKFVGDYDPTRVKAKLHKYETHVFDDIVWGERGIYFFYKYGEDSMAKSRKRSDMMVLNLEDKTSFKMFLVFK